MKNTTPTKVHPLAWVATVYFAMGLPFVMLSTVSGMMYQDMGVSLTKITFWTSFIMLPWTLKPLWSPFLEMFRTKKYFVVGTQLITGIAFAMIALCLPLPSFFTYTIALMGIIAISGATHDIAGDGIYLTELDSQTQAKYIGWQGAFYNMAKVFAMGGLVFVLGLLKKSMGASVEVGSVAGSSAVMHSWMIVIGVCASFMILLSLYHSRILPTGGAAATKINSFSSGVKSLGEIFRTFFTKKYIIWYIIFIILYRFAEGYAMKIVPLFLRSPVAEGGLGLVDQDMGVIYGTGAPLAFIAGSILSGYYIAARGLRKTLFSLCCIFNIPFLVYLLFALYQPSSLWVIGTGVVMEYFGYGFGFVGLTLFMMQQIAPGRHKMAHYAFATGIMNLGVMLPGMMSGWLCDRLGYHGFFIWVAFATIPAFFATWFVLRTIPPHQKNIGVQSGEIITEEIK